MNHIYNIQGLETIEMMWLMKEKRSGINYTLYGMNFHRFIGCGFYYTNAIKKYGFVRKKKIAYFFLS